LVWVPEKGGWRRESLDLRERIGIENWKEHPELCGETQPSLARRSSTNLLRSRFFIQEK